MDAWLNVLELIDNEWLPPLLLLAGLLLSPYFTYSVLNRRGADRHLLRLGQGRGGTRARSSEAPFSPAGIREGGDRAKVNRAFAGEILTARLPPGA